MGCTGSTGKRRNGARVEHLRRPSCGLMQACRVSGWYMYGDDFPPCRRCGSDIDAPLTPRSLRSTISRQPSVDSQWTVSGQSVGSQWTASGQSGWHHLTLTCHLKRKRIRHHKTHKFFFKGRPALSLLLCNTQHLLPSLHGFAPSAHTATLVVSNSATCADTPEVKMQTKSRAQMNLIATSAWPIRQMLSCCRVVMVACAGHAWQNLSA